MLKLYENIRRLRKENHWTQEDLARRMGYTDRSMIAKIEAGKVDITQSKIMDFAKVLGVEPGELMGWEEPEEITPAMQVFVDLYANQKNDAMLLELFHNASEKDQAMVRYILGFPEPSDEIPHLKNKKD